MGKVKSCFRIVFYVFISLFLICYFITAFDKGYEDLGGGYQYHEDGCGAIFGEQVDVLPTVVNYEYDKHFIIIHQNFFGNKYYGFGEVKHGFNYSSYDDDNYWIIDKKEDKYYGPLSLVSFNSKCDSLGVKLKFDPKKDRKRNN